MSDADGYRLDFSDEESASNLLLWNHFYDTFPEMTEETSPVALEVDCPVCEASGTLEGAILVVKNDELFGNRQLVPDVFGCYNCECFLGRKAAPLLQAMFGPDVWDGHMELWHDPDISLPAGHDDKVDVLLSEL